MQLNKKTNLIFVGPSDTIDLIKNAKILIKDKNYKNINILGYISKIKKNTFPHKNYRFLGKDSFLRKKVKNKTFFVNNVYSNQSRERLFKIAKSSNYLLVSVIFNDVLIFSNVKILSSNIIYPRSIISTNASLKFGNILSYNSLIGHDVKLGNFNFIGPGSKILGEATIGNNCIIGSNVKIMPKVKIGNNVRINSGLTIHSDIKSNHSLIKSKEYRSIKN